MKKRLILLITALIISLKCIPSFAEEVTWNEGQLQKIDKTKEEFSFAVFADNRDAGEVFENLMDKINSGDALFAIDTGDLVTYGRQEEFDLFMEQIKRLNKPLLTAIGNHETYAPNGRINYHKLFGKFYYSFLIGGSYFIILDSSNETNLEPGQIRWLKNELTESQRCKNRFVFMHIPLYDPRQGEYKAGHSLGDLDLAKRLNDIFDKNNVTMLFVSHIHGYFQGVWGKTPYIITGGGGVRLDGDDPAHYFYHYIKVKVLKSGVQYEVVKI